MSKMPAATYNVSNTEENKLRGRDQSFRNCVVTMMFFILLCVIIILATIPWRNTSLRRNTGSDEYDVAGKPNREDRLWKERGNGDKSTERLPTPSTTKFRYPTTAPAAATTMRTRKTVPTQITEKLIPSQPTTYPTTVATTTTTRTVEITSTVAPATTEPSTVTTKNILKSSSHILNSETPSLQTTTTGKFRPSSSEIPSKVTISSGTTNSGRSTTISNQNADPSWTTSRNSSPSSSTPQTSYTTLSGRVRDEGKTSATTSKQHVYSTEFFWWNWGARTTTPRDDVIRSTRENQNSSGLSSTLQPSTSSGERIWRWNSSQFDFQTSTQRDDSVQITTSIVSRKTVPSLSTNPSDYESSSISSDSVSEPVDSATTVPPREETSEIVSQPSTGRRVSLSNSYVTPTQLSTKADFSVSSQFINTESTFTNRDGSTDGNETEEFSVESSTESSTDISTTYEESDDSSDYTTTVTDNLNGPGKKVRTGKNRQFSSLETLIVSTFYQNISNTSVTETDYDWLEEFESATTLVDETNDTQVVEQIFTAAARSAENNSEASSTYALGIDSAIESPVTVQVNADDVENDVGTQTSSDQNRDATTVDIYTDEEQKRTTLDTFSSTTGAMEKNRKKTHKVCLTGHCKNIASRMMSYMNHSVDPCEDFYEFACGGMEADPQIKIRNLADQAYDRIQNQLKKSGHNEYLYFKNYYRNCVEYYQETTQEQKVHQARNMLRNIKSLFENIDHYRGITQLIAYMILHNNPLLFDIVPEINEKNPQEFILRIGPVIDNNNPFRNFMKHSCVLEDDDVQSDDIDLGKLYDDYENCKNEEKNTERYMTQIFRILDIFNNANDTNDDLDDDHHMIMGNFDSHMTNMFSNYPRTSEIHAIYESKNYHTITIGDLQDEIRFINWTELIYELTRKDLSFNAELQIYMKDHLMNVLKDLGGIEDLQHIFNGLYWLCARNLYEQFVKPESIGYSEKQCLNIAMNYLPDDASLLYMSSFTGEEIGLMNSSINKIFENLRETLKLKFEHLQWVTEEHRQELIKKIADLQIFSPDNLYSRNVIEINSKDKFLDSTVKLMMKLRADMYNILDKTPKDDKLLWTYFAKPFQPLSQAIHSLNIILIPFGAIDTSRMMQTDNFDYLTFATVGNLVAREIAHHFDRNGFIYRNAAHDSSPVSRRSEYYTYKDHIDCHRDDLFKKPINMLLPASNKRIRFTIPPETVNERLSDVIGVKLAHDTLARMESTSSELLPWLELDIHKLFYLAHAQTYCTKEPLTSSAVSLYENFIMPSRLRIFAAALNNEDIGELWKCREGSPVLPGYTCDIFPDLEYQDAPIGSM